MGLGEPPEVFLLRKKIVPEWVRFWRLFTNLTEIKKMRTFEGTHYDWLGMKMDLFTFKKGDFAENMENVKMGANLYIEWLVNYIKVRSAYKKGMVKCRIAMLEFIADNAQWYIDNGNNGKYFHSAITSNNIEDYARLVLLNGANDIEQWVEDGNSLIYNKEICATFCSPSVQRKKNYGLLPPSRYGEWISVLKKAEKMNYLNVMRWFKRIQIFKEVAEEFSTFVCKKCGLINHYNGNVCARCGHVHED